MRNRDIARVIVGLVWVLTLGVAAPASGAAQATPSTTDSTGGTDAASCTIEPRDFDDLANLASMPPADAATLPSGGDSADPETIATVTETIRMAVACANANDPLRSYALFTDRYLGERFGAAHPDDLGSLYASHSREPTPADQADLLALVEIRDVTVPAEGWVEATVVTENRATRYVDRLVLQLVGDRWLIDSWSPVEDEATPAA